MTKRTLLRTALGFLVLLAASGPLCGGTAGAAEKARIEALIAHLEGLGDASFVRNGRDYNARNAAKFLRGKWQANDAQIKTAADFIVTAASVSSTTGKPYLIRFKDGSVIPCGAYLTAQLKHLDAAAKAK
jgi:hypothetical protein